MLHCTTGNIPALTQRNSMMLTVLLQLDINAVFLPCHWLYEWSSQFHSCGIYSVLSRSPSVTDITSDSYGCQCMMLKASLMYNGFLSCGTGKTGCWFVGVDYLTDDLLVLQLQLSPPPPSSLAPIKSRMETFWYRLIQINLEKCC